MEVDKEVWLLIAGGMWAVEIIVFVDFSFTKFHVYFCSLIVVSMYYSRLVTHTTSMTLTLLPCRV